VTALDLVVALAILLGLVGAVVQVVPGGLVVGGAVAVWGGAVGGLVGWTLAGVAVVLTLAAAVLKYVLTGRHLSRHRIPQRSILIGAVAGVVGFFVLPVVGLFVGFVGGIHLAELHRLRDDAAARRATVLALKAVGISILVELGAALATAGCWLAALIATRW